MFTRWTSHLKDENEKKRFRETVVSCKPVLDHLRGLLEEMELDLNRAEINPKTYDIPNWDYRQAHNNGYRQCLQYLQKFIDLDKQVLTIETDKGIIEV